MLKQTVASEILIAKPVRGFSRHKDVSTRWEAFPGSSL